ncbi:type 1 glutamine amidotransferase domain-containing protein [Streptomyces liangshanensis]|uniref:Type 1 glutamine amidotransferase domain-containing protein n=1 Tax=Streptomyces liangshanensis TaxID=2717324 RepID=A0A6G9GUX3_9ACTN|nr:type 1 glutamine amidotransferase domain-containing protein [Streptomyces liangshanensis]QIQ01876.1 type 1 glutamine amidotransferase domain-containing protein [Streptomyces liangshanensis]
MTSVLLVVSSADVWTLKDGSKHPTGFWASEFIDPHLVFGEAGYDITIATPGGIAPTVDEFSLAPEMNNNDRSAIDKQRAYLAALGTELTRPVRLEDVDADDYDAVYVSGGHGPMEDLAVNEKIGAIFTTLLARQDKVVAAVCHGVGALLPATNEDGTWPFAGRRITGLTDEEETALGFGDKAPWLLESRLRSAGADFSGGAPFGPHVVVDGNLVTGQNPASARPSAEAVVTALSGVTAK